MRVRVSAKWVVLWSLWAARLAREPTAPLRVRGGLVRGALARDGSHAAYLGIPYATLTQENRFQAPDPEPTWEGIHDAVDDKIVCVQSTLYFNYVLGREQCLTLNVYTPVFPAENKLPVMVFIHGGGFIEGSGTPIAYGPNYLVPKGVILVTFNYRVGMQGYLSLGIKEAPGNAGMKDQVAALRWVQNNIAVFGGDPGNVTLFGESAGGASVSYHLLSPMSKGLFHRAILQSGSSLMSWAHQATPELNARLVAKAMGYDIEEPHELYHLFKNMDATDLVLYNTLKDEKKILLSTLIYAPVVEKKFKGVEPFLTEHPYKLLREGKFHKVPIMTGTNDEEGYLFVGIEESSLFSTIDFEQSLPSDLVFPTESEKKRIANEIRQMYMGDELISEAASSKLKLSRFYGEPFFNYAPLAETELILNSTDQPVYHYHMKYDGVRNLIKQFLGEPFKSAGGASHADDLFYLFYQSFTPDMFDRQMIDRMTTMWTNFAKYSDPTPSATDLLPVRWHPTTLDDPLAFVIDRDFYTIPLWHRKTLKHWKDLYSKYRKVCVCCV